MSVFVGHPLAGADRARVSARTYHAHEFDNLRLPLVRPTFNRHNSLGNHR